MENRKEREENHTLKVLMANRLIDGRVVWYSIDGDWRRNINDSLVAEDIQTQSHLDRVGRMAVLNNEVINALLVGVRKHAGKLYALRLRERIQSSGPTGSCT